MFYPNEVIIAITTQCNLSCRYCQDKNTHATINFTQAKKFLTSCADYGINKLNFSGGEPFLKTGLLFKLVNTAVSLNFSFGQIITNGVWHKNLKQLKNTITKLKNHGYDGKFVLSYDAMHNQKPQTVASFIKTVLGIYRQIDSLAIAYTTGENDQKTKQMLFALAEILSGQITFKKNGFSQIKLTPYIIRLYSIQLVKPAENTTKQFKKPKTNFVSGHCLKLGNIFYVFANGNIAPCCGYANHLPALSLGNIKNTNAKDALINAYANRNVYNIFNSPPKVTRTSTVNPCVFCADFWQLEKH